MVIHTIKNVIRHQNKSVPFKWFQLDIDTYIKTIICVNYTSNLFTTIHRIYDLKISLKIFMTLDLLHFILMTIWLHYSISFNLYQSSVPEWWVELGRRQHIHHLHLMMTYGQSWLNLEYFPWKSIVISKWCKKCVTKRQKNIWISMTQFWKSLFYLLDKLGDSTYSPSGTPFTPP